MNNKLLILVDGSSYLYRAFHALPPLHNSKGMPTGAIYGVLNMLRKLLMEHQPHYVAVVFDAKGKTFRDEIYAEYKAHRPSMPEELKVQIQPLHDIIRAMHIPLLCVDGVEADDVIGTLACQAEQIGLSVLISTGDKDLAQLVSPKVTLINTMNNKVYNRAGVIEKFGVPPELIIDYLTLVGDSSDNIPGIAGVGPKTAVKWLTEFGSLKNIMEQAACIKGKVGENLRNQLDKIPLIRQLVTIKCDVPLTYKISELLPGELDKDRLKNFFQELEFKSWAAELSSSTPEPLQKEKKYFTILTEEDFSIWLDKLQSAELICVDTETTSLDYMYAEIVGLSFAIEPNEAIYIPVAHDYIGAPQQLNRSYVLNKLKPLLEDPNLKKSRS